MPNHSNPNGIVFGGIIMSWIDLAAAMVAQKHSGMDVATIRVSEVNFKMPMRIGDHVQVEAKLYYVGKSSMIIGVDVFAEGPKMNKAVHTTSAMLTMVGLDKSGKPTPVPELSLVTEKDFENFKIGKSLVRNFNNT